MNPIVTTEQMQLAESNAVRRGLHHVNMAQNAAAACFSYITQVVGDIRNKAITILCGRGMNGGDGILLATLLKDARADTLCIFIGDPPNDGVAGQIYASYAPSLVMTSYSGGIDNLNAAKYALQNSHIIIDCVFGTAFRGELDYKTAELFSFINAGCPEVAKFSVDLPSGVNADSGKRDENAFIPDVTLVLGAYKKGLLSHPTRDYCGECVLMDIGLGEGDYVKYEALFTGEEILSLLPKRGKSAHKGTFGKLLNIAGSEKYIGAAMLSTKAAIRAGAGLVTLATPRQVVYALAAAIPEAVFLHTEYGFKTFTAELQSADAVALGCGMGNTPETRKIVEFVVRNVVCPVVLDADGINSISDNINVLRDNDRLVITPHPAEFARVTGLTVEEVQANRVDYAKIFARESGAIVVLKGVNTVVASPDGAAYVNPTGNPGLAKAGTGDVLTGVIAALAAQGVPLFEAAVLGVYLHGAAADKLAESRSLSSMTASDLLELL